MSARYLHTFFLVSALSLTAAFSQNKDLIITAKDTVDVQPVEFDMLAPARAAFYSAVLPGLGQAYNKKYWKIPFVYATIGTGIFIYDRNNKNYNRARDAYKLRINGKPDEFDGTEGKIFLSEDALISAQKSYKKDKDLSILVTVVFYILQIVEASTNAHLLQHNVDNNLSLSPGLIKDINSNKSIVGASFNIKF